MLKKDLISNFASAAKLSGAIEARRPRRAMLPAKTHVKYSLVTIASIFFKYQCINVSAGYTSTITAKSMIITKLYLL